MDKPDAPTVSGQTTASAKASEPTSDVEQTTTANSALTTLNSNVVMDTLNNAVAMETPKPDDAETQEFKDHVMHANERSSKMSALGPVYDPVKRRVSNSSMSGCDPSKRRESSASVKSSSSRRGSSVAADDDEFDENGLPPIPNITYRKGSIVSFPITDDLPCMKNKRHSITSVSSNRTDTSEDVPNIAFRKSSISVLYIIPDRLLKEDLNENEEDLDKSIKEYELGGRKPSLTPKKKTLTFNDLLGQMGQFGRFQVYLLLCMIPYMMSYSWLLSSQGYLTLLPERYWCNVPALENMTTAARRNLSIPQISPGVYEHCQVYSPEDDTWPLEASLRDDAWNVTEGCADGWLYEMEDISYASIAVENNWVCEQLSHSTFSEAAFLLGSIVGGFIFSWVADRFGRIPAILGSNFVGFVGGVATLFAKDVILFSATRLLSGVGYFNAFIFFYTLVLEYVSHKWCTFALTFQFLLTYTASSVALPWVASFLADWRWLSAVTSIPLLIGFLLAFLIPESARWQMATGQMDKAIETLKKVEKINKVQIDPKLYVQLKESYSREYPTLGKTKANVLSILKTKNLRRNIYTCVVMWICLWLMYPAFTRQPRHFNWSLFSTSSLFSLTNILSCLVVLLAMDVWGRKWLVFASLFLAAVTIPFSTIDTAGLLSSITALIGQFLLNITHIVSLQVAGEVLPTVVRGEGLNLMHVCGCVARMVAPFVLQIGDSHPALPPVILSLLGVFGAFNSVLLPETKTRSLPETVDDGRAMKEENLYDILFCDSEFLDED